jgi:adenine/guanine/hypoxanthine permease
MPRPSSWRCNAATVGFDKLGQVGVIYQGLNVLGSGAILVSLILAAITAFIIDRAFMKAAGFALAGGLLTFFGFMHSEAIGVGKTPMVALSYAVVALALWGCARYAATTPQSQQSPPLTTDHHSPEAKLGSAA